MVQRTWLIIPAILMATQGCSSAGSSDPFGEGTSGVSSEAGTGGEGGLLDIDSGTDDGILVVEPPCDQNLPESDVDQDGWTVGMGDCNDCTAQMNPGAFDYPGNGVDEDCSGVADDEPVGCDENLPMDGDAFSAARSLGICRFAQPGAQGKDRTWGVIHAAYVFADGSTVSGPPHTAFECPGGAGGPPNPYSYGILPRFGPAVAPRAQASMVALSSGVAREGVNGDSPAGGLMCTRSGTPAGFPTPSTEACPGIDIDDKAVAHDPMALELLIRAPSNARSFAFDFDFYTYEYPQYVCSDFNDFFVALVFGSHPSLPANKNISFDAMGNPVSVNNGFLDVCTPGNHGGKSFPCSLGTNELNGTGFEGHAATGWLQTSSPIVPGEEFTVRFAIWDMGDEVLDSTVLIDNFRWDVKEGETQTERPPLK